MTRWHDDDEFWAEFGEFIFDADRWEKASDEIDAVLVLSQVAAGARVLDMACGPGRHLLELARRGYPVVGVDRTRSYLDRAGERARAEGLVLELVEEDMRDFVRPDSFDLALNLFTAFGYFDDPADDRKVAANLYASLAPGGVLVMELIGREIIARIFVERNWNQLGPGRFMLEERKIERDFTWIDNRWILIDQGKIIERRVSHRLYSGSELAGLLREVGFARVDLYGNIAGDPYDNNARRLVLVARK